MQSKRRRRTPRYDVIVEYPEDEYEDDGNEYYDDFYWKWIDTLLYSSYQKKLCYNKIMYKIRNF